MGYIGPRDKFWLQVVVYIVLRHKAKSSEAPDSSLQRNLLIQDQGSWIDISE